MPAAATAPTANAGPPVDTQARFQYRLSSLLLIMTLIAILSGLIAMHQGFGIVVAILALPALVRTCITATRAGAGGQPVSAGDKMGIFVVIFVPTLFMAGIVGGVAYGVFLFTDCALHLGLGSSGGTDPRAVMAGLVVAGLLAGLLAGLFWWLSHDKRKP